MADAAPPARVEARRLISIGPSHFCEKARWALQRARLPFTEELWVPGLHVWGVRRAGGQRSTPVLVLADEVISDSTDILAYIQSHPDAAWRPYASEADHRLEDDYDLRLGPHTRRLAYYHLLKDLKGLREAADHWVGPRSGQRRLFGLLVRPIRALMRASMRIDAEGAERSLASIDAVFTEVETLLADGRRYLAGDAFSGADLTFASLAAPVVLPTTYGAWLPPLETTPAPFQEVVAAHRARPAGAFALRLYADHRAG
ncbi:MAG: glutathione S-transferase N-terminal domain-containing protein [Myxococcales bacterium]|nr:glutathione S-transferase N-terminal domain-containing protein [Myxococcales bacterium]